MVSLRRAAEKKMQFLNRTFLAPKKGLIYILLEHFRRTFISNKDNY